MRQLQSEEGEVATGGEPSESTDERRRHTSSLIHLPTWSRLRIAARQSAPVGRGGDFYEIIQHRDGRVSVVMADVCGNGPSAAVPVAQLRWISRQQLTRGEAPGTVLAKLNDWLTEDKLQERFVTALCLRIDPFGGTTEVASAGHLGPFIKRAGGTAEDLPLSVGLALGILPAQVYQHAEMNLDPEDALVLVTDGITDRFASAGDPLGQVAMRERLQQVHPGTEAICTALLRRGETQSADATVIVLQLPRRSRRATPTRRAAR